MGGLQQPRTDVQPIKGSCQKQDVFSTFPNNDGFGHVEWCHLQHVGRNEVGRDGLKGDGDGGTQPPTDVQPGSDQSSTKRKQSVAESIVRKMAKGSTDYFNLCYQSGLPKSPKIYYVEAILIGHKIISYIY